MMPILLRLLCVDAMSVCQSVSDLHLSVFWSVCLCLFLSLPVSLSLFVPLPVSHFVSLSLLLPCPLTLSLSLSHPVLGWLYVFSPFPPRPCPPPQKLFPLTSKPFELNLWYLAQRIYGSGELYWMTFPWPWPKVTAVASISQNVLVCAIKWEPLLFLQIFFKNFGCVFQGQTLFWPYLRNGWSDWCETKRKCIGWILGTICDLDLWPPSWPWPWMFPGQISK